MALKDNLIAYYKCDEASGSLLNAHDSGVHDLTENGTIGSTTGKLGNARALDANEYFSETDHADFSPTGDFGCLGWVNYASLGAIQTIVSKWLTTGNQRSYEFGWHSTPSTFRLQATANGSTTVTLDWSAAYSDTGVWTMFFFGFDDTANEIVMQIDNGTEVRASIASIFDGTAVFAIGGRLTIQDIIGSIDGIAFWNGRFPSTTERTEIWNSGDGLDYDDWDAAAGGGPGRLIQGGLINGGLLVGGGRLVA